MPVREGATTSAERSGHHVGTLTVGGHVRRTGQVTNLDYSAPKESSFLRVRHRIGRGLIEKQPATRCSAWLQDVQMTVLGSTVVVAIVSPQIGPSYSAVTVSSGQMLIGRDEYVKAGGPNVTLVNSAAGANIFLPSGDALWAVGVGGSCTYTVTIIPVLAGAGLGTQTAIDASRHGHSAPRGANGWGCWARR